jgi:ATP-binding cassette subfamily B protein
MKVEQLDAFLRNASCFVVLADAQLQRLRDRVDIRSYKLGEVVFRQGDAADRMYLVYSGKVRVLRAEGEGEVPLNTLYPGEHFGEMALVSGQPRNATIRAAADSTLISVPADSVQELLKQSSELRKYFDEYVDRLQLWNFIKLVDRFGAHLHRDQLRQLVDRFRPMKVEAGQPILNQDEPCQHFFLIQAGRVQAARDGQLHATLAPGDSFGAGPLLSDPPGVSRWTITAVDPVKLLALQADDFRRLLSDVPTLRKFFEEQLAHYRADEAAAHFDTISLKPPQAADETADQVAEVEAREERAAAQALPQELEAAAREGAIPAFAEPTGDEAAQVAVPAGFWARWRFPFSPQHDETDCGAACLAMITGYYGRSVGVSRLRDLAGVGVEGASLAQLGEAAHAVGYRTRALRLSADRLDRLRRPAILFWRGYHYVVLYALTPRHAYIADPAVGKVRIDRKALAEDYSGYALEVEPTGETAKVRARDSATTYLLQLLRGRGALLAGIIATTLVVKLCEYAFVKFTETIVDELEPHMGLSTFHFMLAIVVLATVVRIALSIWQALAGARLGNDLDRSMLGRFFEHLLTLPTRFFKLRRIGDIMARFGDNSHVRALFTGGALTVIIELPASIFWFYMMFSRNVELTLVVLAFLPFFIGFTLLSSPILKRMMRRVIEDGAAEQSNLIEAVQGIDLVKSMAMERPFHAKWQGLFEKARASGYRYARMLQAFGAAGSSLEVLSSLALLWYGAVLVNAGRLTVGELVAFTMLAPLAMGPIMSLIGLWDELQEAKVSLERLSDVLDSDPEPQPPREKRVHPERLSGRIKFEGVYFHYGAKHAPYVLRNISFEAKPGQSIAIVGRSGCGKTTLARLLLGLYQPTEGHIEIDRWNLSQLDLETYRRQIGVVLQENLLFSGTISDNIALGDTSPDRERMREAAQLAGADEFIAKLPLGYSAVVGEFGLTLSGGQRQRIALARALYRNPRILVLDEATSALDSLSEREIQKNMDVILRDRTAIIIAHKIATVRSADQILVLHEGRIVEQGTHDELFAKRGTYYYLASQQLNL